MIKGAFDWAYYMKKRNWKTEKEKTVGWMLYSRSPRKLFAMEGLYRLNNFWNKYAFTSVCHLRKYGKDFLFCFSNYPFLLSVSYFLDLNMVNFHQRSPPSVFLCKLFVNHCPSATQRNAVILLPAAECVEYIPLTESEFEIKSQTNGYSGLV